MPSAARLRLAAALVAAACGACAAAPPVVDALLVDPTPEARAQLAQTVADAIAGRPGAPPARLADSALMQSPFLTLGHAALTDPLGLPALGRETQRPESFRLRLVGHECMLEHLRDGRRYPLAAARCRPA